MATGQDVASYYRNRERVQREIAEQAADTAIRKIHLELAERYAKLANEHQRAEEGSSLNGSRTPDDAGA